MGDLLYHFTEYLRTTQLVELALWISDTSISMWIVTHFWAIPIIQCVHIIAIAASFASILMINAWELLLKARILEQNNNKVKSILHFESKQKDTVSSVL